ncbi:MAG TPA: hypothetical protein VG944_11775 [Fimbriimonas sp.]|nr:hypothetical protein [Fimbriimonas sp.]
MKRKLVLPVLCLVALGCGSDTPTGKDAMSSADRVQFAAQKIQSDPSSSPAARSIAGGVIQDAKNERDLSNMMESKE